MKYFESDYIQFFKDLSANNNTTWFGEQRKRYENSVKKPFAAFVSAMIENIQAEDPTLTIQAGNCILRINRDIRFSKDKTPYNLHCTAFISNGGRKDKSIPGFFLRLSPEMIGIMGGCFGPSKEQLHKIREQIASDPAAMADLLREKSFVEHFGALRGESNKRLPAEWKDLAVKVPLLAQKQFYFSAELDPGLILKDELVDTLMAYWQAARPINTYLLKAIV